MFFLTSYLPGISVKDYPYYEFSIEFSHEVISPKKNQLKKFIDIINFTDIDNINYHYELFDKTQKIQEITFQFKNLTKPSQKMIYELCLLAHSVAYSQTPIHLIGDAEKKIGIKGVNKIIYFEKQTSLTKRINEDNIEKYVK